jgi:2-keto-3-deoxy-L-arabinonate dehydratase
MGGADVTTEICGTYPMLYAFFGADGAVLRDPITAQIEAAIRAGAEGVAVLGLATEVGKLGRAEQRQLVEWVAHDLRGRLPFAVTVADGNVADMILSAQFAERAGAAWLILQPPRPPVTGAQLIAFFVAVAREVSIPVAIQNAPEFLGIGMTPAELLALHEVQPNVCMVKAESTAVGVARLIETVGSRMTVFNGRAGLELTDNYRAGCKGMIPGVETIDLQAAIGQAMAKGDEARAEALYARVLPAVTFVMQGLPHLVLYGKLIAAHRLGLAPSYLRNPSDDPTPQGLAWARRFARDLGPLTGAIA